MNRKKYEVFLRIASVAAALVLWGFSVDFSADGFNFRTENMKAAGVLLAICITIVELVWNKAADSGNLVIFVCGLAAYMYGTVTNVVGLSVARGSISFIQDPLAYGIPLFAGIILEILPEPLLIWGLLGEFWGGDFLTSMFGASNPRSKGGSPSGGYPVSQYSTKNVPGNDRGGNPYNR